MTRNLNRRVEIACPVYDDEIREQLQWILATQLQDNAKASFMMPDGLYRRKEGKLPISLNSQERFMELSPHSQVPPETAKEKPVSIILSLLQRLLQKIR